MTSRILTLDGLSRRGHRPALYELRVLERSLLERIAGLDARVDPLLMLDEPPTDEQIGAVDVLCAAIAELQELLDEVRAEAAHDVVRRRARRAGQRRWA
jgi:hypothetical protein